MNHSDLKKQLSVITQEIDRVADEKTHPIFNALLNIIELLISENAELKKENQLLRNEINQLKGEKGQPRFRQQSKPTDHSSEKDRKPRGQQPKPKKRDKKKGKLKVTRREVCEMSRDELPADAQFKGYQTQLIQDIRIERDVIEFKKQVYYSPSLKKTFTASLPLGYEGEFGPSLKALVIDCHRSLQMTQSAIHRLLTNHGIVISLASIARLLTEDVGDFKAEKEAIITEGVSSTLYQQMDDTGARCEGQNYYTHILCNPFYTAYFTRKNKDRLTVIELLMMGKMHFELSEASYALMEAMKLSDRSIQQLKEKALKPLMNRVEMDTLLEALFPFRHKQVSNRQIILEASAITAYQHSAKAIKLLLVDDARQFKQITELLALCWIHDGRHYKKLNPLTTLHQEQLHHFLSDYWDYYHALLAYKENPCGSRAQLLSEQFDELFSRRTGYDLLDERIDKTHLKKESLLWVLQYPELPLHNNCSELGARAQARYRDISFHTMSQQGTQMKDALMTIVQTAKKLSVNTYEYIYDRITKTYRLPSLACLIQEKAQQHLATMPIFNTT